MGYRTRTVETDVISPYTPESSYPSGSPGVPYPADVLGGVHHPLSTRGLVSVRSVRDPFKSLPVGPELRRRQGGRGRTGLGESCVEPGVRW